MATSAETDDPFPEFERRRREPSSGTGPDRVYERTVALLREWAAAADERSRGGSREHHLRRFLWSELTADGERVSVTSPRGTDTPDIVVDGSVGIEMVSSLNQGATGWFHRELHTLGEGYEHLVVFGNDIDGEHLDRWRHLQSSITHDDVGLRGIAFVDTIDEESGPEGSAGRLVAPETAAILLLSLPIAALAAQLLVDFLLSLETTGSSLVVAVVIVYLVGVSLLGCVLKLL